jgi:hypothetical protein
VLVAVCDWGDDGGRDEADDYEDCAGDAGFCFGEAVGAEDLVEEGGDAVEEADVDGEGDEDLPEFAGCEELACCDAEGDLRGCAGGAGWCWGCGGEEE